jgi:hypothetical protein
MNDLPKVLVIASTPFSKTKNNGKTLSSFFETYDRTLIAQFSYSGGDFNSDICDNYYFFTKEDVLRGNKGAAYKSAGILMKENIMESGKKKSFIKRFFHVFSQARNPIALWIKDRIWKKADYSKALDWIDQFDPDVVFFQGFSMAYGYDFALNVCKRNNIPLILELTDDYTYRLYPLSIIEKINHKRYMNVFTEAITLASKTIVISDLMKEEYESRFGGDMDVMMNAVNTKNFNYDCERTPNDYVYAGNLLLNRWKVLRNLGKALLQINQKATLNIYTPDVPPKHILKSLSKVSSIRYGGRLTKDELECRLKKCEYVVHVEAFDKKNRKITRLSMSTKISEYVACGAKILAIGPSDVASMKCISDNNLGIWIYNPSVKKITERLNREITVEDYERNATEFIKKCASESNGTRIKKYITDTVTYCRNENV